MPSRQTERQRFSIRVNIVQPKIKTNKTGKNNFVILKSAKQTYFVKRAVPDVT